MTRVVSFFIVIGCSTLLFFTGCGGGNSSPAPAPAPAPSVSQEADAEEADAEEEEEKEKEKKQETKKKKKKKKVKKEEAPEEEKDELPPELQKPEMTLPAASSQWTEKEFVYLRSAQPDLFDMAITELTTRLANPDGADSAAGILNQFVHSVIPAALEQEEQLRAKGKALEELLKEDEEAQKKMRSAKAIELKFYQLSQMQIRTIMEALASNSSETASKTVAAFLAGGILTDDNKSALETIMFAYAQKSRDGKLSAEEEEILLSFLLMPENAVKIAAEYAGIELPKGQIAELDAEGNQVQNNSNQNRMRANHQPILISAEKKVVFKFSGGTGNMPEFSPQDVQESVLKNFCPSSTPLFRARIARELVGNEVLEAANTQEKQEFLLHDVLDGFLMKTDFENVIAHVLIYKQPDLDDELREKLKANLLLSHQALLRTQFGFIDEKTAENYRTVVTEKRDRLAEEKQAQRDAERSASETSTEQVAVSLLSRKAAADKNARNQNQNRNPNMNRNSKVDPVVTLLMNPKDREALASEIWTADIRDALQEEISETLGNVIDEGMANLPEPGSKARVALPTIDREDLQAIQMYMMIPCIDSRYKIYTLLDRAWLLGPEAFRATIFDKMEVEPGFLMVLKSMDRRVAPKEREVRKTTNKNKNIRKKPNVKPKDPSPAQLLREKKIEMGVAWMDQCYKSVCQWCKTYSDAAKMQNELKKINRILDKEAPKVAEPELPKELQELVPPSCKVVSYYTAKDPAMPPLAESSALKITFFELETRTQLAKLVSAFKSRIPKLLERGVMTKPTGQNVVVNGHWLERFVVNDSGRRESVDVLIAPANQDSRQSNRNQEDSHDVSEYRIYVLMMEMDDLTGDHVSNLSDESGEDVEFADEEGDGEDGEYADEDDYADEGEYEE
ncbi:MAG: hypothetical protein Q4C70_06865 [Planctomycetia bacterium]|nr:hypothetical protein [Planctomycetia bacterium]